MEKYSEKSEQITSISHTTSSEDITLKPATLTSIEKNSSETPQIISPPTEEKCSKDEGIETFSDEEEDYEYISGYKVFVVLAAITLTTFLALLDTTIVATVSTVL